MPGLQLFDESRTSQIYINSASKPHLFQSPRTPSTASSAYLSAQSSANLAPSTNANRKRLRHDSADLSTLHSAPTNRWSSISSVPASIANNPDVISPAPFVNTKYRLAGGLDTPTASTRFGYDENTYNGYSPDQAYRRGRGWSNTGSATSESYFPHISSALAKDGNGRRRGLSNTPRTGWGKAVVTAFGGVAGKVWEFCKTGAFRGFYAGGGQDWAISPPISSYQPDSGHSSNWLDDTVSMSVATTPFTSINLPGHFPDSDFIPNYLSHDHTPPSRPAKRVHLDNSNNDPGATWVLVTASTDSPPPLPHESPTPSRIPVRKPPKQPASSPSPRRCRPSLLPIRSSTISSSYARSTTNANNRTASSASSRSTLITPTRERANPLHPRCSPHLQSAKVSPIKHNDTNNKNNTASPLSPEALRFQADLRRRDEEENRELGRLNRRLKAMIREGKEALGTRVDVFSSGGVGGGIGEDEGFVDWDGGR
ncbi:hypothetical protein MMC14_002260 [Varicellaria rhodocarpa]|nr:hypothetical protein [Varicellaria rhodocarpa]